MKDVFWIVADPPVTLAILLCPCGGRGLYDDLAIYRRQGVQTLVSLLSEKQVQMLGLDEEGPLAESLGMQFLWHPLPDHDTPPDLPAFRAFAADLAARLVAGEQIGIHCWGSIGRATVTAACTLIHLGWNPSAALAAIEEARGRQVPDTEEQQDWILNYQAHP